MPEPSGNDQNIGLHYFDHYRLCHVVCIGAIVEQLLPELDRTLFYAKDSRHIETVMQYLLQM